jgi:cytochrome P450
MIEFRRDPIAFMMRIQKQYGNLVALAGTRKRVIAAFGPKYNQMLYADHERFQPCGFILKGPRDSAQRRLSETRFTVHDGQDQGIRGPLLEVFQGFNVGVFSDDLAHILDRFQAGWRPGEKRDILVETQKLCGAIAIKLLFGMDVDDEDNLLLAEIEGWLQMNSSAYVRMLRANWLFTPYRRMLLRARRVEGRILALLRTRTQTSGAGRDVLSLLTRALENTSGASTETGLVGQTLAMLLFAFESTAHTMTWTLFLLAQHPSVQEAVLDELALLRGEVPTAEQLDQLRYLDQVVTESMRILPAVVLSRRIATEDAELAPYFIPRRTRIWFSHYVTHHMPELFSEPEKFRPDRWPSTSAAAGVYFPFGAGARYCVGADFARFVLKASLATLLPRWRFMVVPNARIDRRVTITLSPKYGMPMLLARQDRRFEASPIRGNIREMVCLEAEPARIASYPSGRRAA